VAFVLVVVLVVVFVVLAPRWNEVFCLSWRDGRALVVRGVVPIRVRQDLVDVLERSGVVRATLRGVRSGGGVRLECSGVDDGTAQRLRNTFGTHSSAGFAGAPEGGRNLGQLLGWVWLSWLLSR
jgi:hypothetical protein